MRMLSLKKALSGLLLMTAVLMLDSCIFNNKVEEKINRTVLVYIGADNNLTGNAVSNIYSMNSSISNGMDNYNLLVYVDRHGVDPALLHIHNFKIDTIAKYPERDSTDPMVLREVIDEVTQNWKADHYGLVLWSHGTGWLPTKMLHYVASNMNYAPLRRGPAYRPEPDEEEMLTKAFAWENRQDQNPAYVCMELDELVDAIPDNLFDFIVFDACYMGNVEVVYALRNKAQQIISSCYEIVSYGFPYHTVTRDFLSGNMLKTCNEFYDYYNNMSGWEQMGGISLVNTSELDSLARCFRKIVHESGDLIREKDVWNVQCFDRFNRHVFFDLKDVVSELEPRKELMTEFTLQLERCVEYKVSTPYIFRGSKSEIKIDSYCGLSVFIPMPKYDSSGLNDEYRKTEWSDFTDY